jgi:hypothetical protein
MGGFDGAGDVDPEAVRLAMAMWTRATEFGGNVVWLNLALARSIVRLAYETADGYDAKTVIVFDSAEQWTVTEKPEALLAFAAAAGGQLAPPVSEGANASNATHPSQA